jgi:ankyrin repeat protein
MLARLDICADINQQKYIDITTGLRKAVYDYKDVVEVVLNKNTMIKPKTMYGEMDLIVAAGKGRDDIVQSLLMDKTIDLNIKDEDGFSPLMAAAGGGHTAIVQALLNKGAEVNTKNLNGETALMWATMFGHYDTVKILLAKGAEVNAKNMNGKTARALAVIFGYDDIVNLLQVKSAMQRQK